MEKNINVQISWGQAKGKGLSLSVKEVNKTVSAMGAIQLLLDFKISPFAFVLHNFFPFKWPITTTILKGN